MSFSDYIAPHGKSVNCEYFLNLVQVSRIDGKISPDELKLLHKLGKDFGLTDPEIDLLISSEVNHPYNPPYSLEEKFDHLYKVALMVLADNEISVAEKRILRRLYIEAGFNDKVIDNLEVVLYDGIKNNESEESLFAKFKKHLLQT